MGITFLSEVQYPALWITLVGLCSAVGAVFLAFASAHQWAITLFIFAGICDLFDGLVARKKTLSAFKKSFGMHIDTVVDAINFGIVPVLLAIMMGYTGVVHYAVYFIYTMCAAVRLAYFNATYDITHIHDKISYIGLPVTYAALIFPLFLTLGFWISKNILFYAMPCLFLLTSLLFVLKIKIPKPSGIWYIFFSLIALALIAIWLIQY